MRNTCRVLSLCLIALSTISSTVKAQTPIGSFYNIKTYGAIGDGKVVDTKAIDKAINAAAEAGGGTVYFPAGNYLSVTIHLKSNVGLYLDHGATIIADKKGYDLPEKNANEIYQDYGHSHFQNSLIFGENLDNISITGPGKIWGRGLLRTSTKTTVNEGFGNKTISLRLCRNVILRDFTVQHGGWFVLLLNAVDNLTIDNLKMDTNRDGMDIISCKNVRISNCFVNSPEDDGICLKSDYALNYARSLENVTITNCQVSGYDEGSLLDGTYKRDPNAVMKGKPIGRIKLGTESNGGYKNITISNCVFDYCRGLALETVDGALLEDVTITNITMRDIVNSPIFVRLGARMRGPEGTPVGSLKRVIISNVVAYNVDTMQGALISGIPGHDIEDLKLSNIHLYFKGGGTKEQIATEVPELENGYPEPASFKTTPSYGFFIRHVKDLKVSDVEVSFMQNDMRPAYFLDHVTGADFQHIRAQKTDGAATFILKQVKNFNIFNSEPVKNTKIIEVESKEL
jgi:polygalacturonase